MITYGQTVIVVEMLKDDYENLIDFFRRMIDKQLIEMDVMWGIVSISFLLAPQGSWVKEPYACWSLDMGYDGCPGSLNFRIYFAFRHIRKTIARNARYCCQSKHTY